MYLPKFSGLVIGGALSVFTGGGDVGGWGTLLGDPDGGEGGEGVEGWEGAFPGDLPTLFNILLFLSIKHKENVMKMEWCVRNNKQSKSKLPTYGSNFSILSVTVI
jgi:hypothetical protein